jgi:hypothetical protein
VNVPLPAITGTNWIWEMVNMLVRQTDAMTPRVTPFFDLYPMKHMSELPPPRVLPSHFLFQHLPEQFKANKGKIIYVVRNPKDVAVSFYHFSKRLEPLQYKGSWDDYLPMFLKGKGE